MLHLLLEALLMEVGVWAHQRDIMTLIDSHLWSACSRVRVGLLLHLVGEVSYDLFYVVLLDASLIEPGVLEIAFGLRARFETWNQAVDVLLLSSSGRLFRHDAWVQISIRVLDLTCRCKICYDLTVEHRVVVRGQSIINCDVLQTLIKW